VTYDEAIATIGTLPVRGLQLMVAVGAALEAGDVQCAADVVNTTRPRSTVAEALLITVALLGVHVDDQDDGRHGCVGGCESFSDYLRRVGLSVAERRARG
jgi:hypothetical protein